MHPGELLRRGRDRLLADARFQRAAVAFAPTRPIARARARQLFDLCAGFVYSQVLQACVALRLPQRLADGPRSAAALAADLAAGVAPDIAPDPVRLGRLLQAAAAIGVLEPRDGDRFGLGPHGAALLGNPGVAAMIEHHRLLYADLAHPLELLRRSAAAPPALAGFWSYAGRGDPTALGSDAVAPYSALMAASQQFVADGVLSAYPVGRHRRLLDVGGGNGTFALEAARRAPRLDVTVFDLPAVARLAGERLAAAGLGTRVRTVGGDFRRDPLPGGADLATLVRVLHDHDDEPALALLAAVGRSLPEGGTLLVAEPLAGADGAGGGVECYFHVYLLAMGSGRPRRRDEVAALVERAGFGALRWRRTRNPMLASVLTARKAARKRHARATP